MIPVPVPLLLFMIPVPVPLLLFISCSTVPYKANSVCSDGLIGVLISPVGNHMNVQQDLMCRQPSFIGVCSLRDHV